MNTDTEVALLLQQINFPEFNPLRDERGKK